MRLLLLTFFLSFTVTSPLFAQKYYVSRKNQMFLGLSGGVNFSFVNVSEHHNVVVPLDAQEEDLVEKSYNSLGDNTSGQFGLFFKYGINRNFSVVFNPTYHNYRFKYMTDYSWSDTITSGDFEIEMLHDQRLNYFTFPLLIRWDITTRQFSPYVQLGIFNEFFHNGNKTIYYDHLIDEQVDMDKPVGSSGKVTISEHINPSNFGFLGGLGFSIYTNYATFGVETNFRYGFSDIVSNDERYTDKTGLTVQYLDVFDQLKLGNLNIQFKVIFPMDKSVDLRILRKARH